VIRIKRVYDRSAKTDGKRVLVDRFWPRGISKEDARIDFWRKDLAPGNELRIWFAHDPSRWAEFKVRFFKELRQKPDVVQGLVTESRNRTVTLLFSSRELRFNHAVALKEFIESRMTLPIKRKAA
jgi:uncharacterized protein YeaO (DUF488 family)